MQSVVRDLAVYTVSTCLGMWVYYEYEKATKRRQDPYAEYVPSLEGFERMDIQAPDMTAHRRDTLDRA